MDLSKLPKLSGRSGDGEPAPGSMMTAADLAQFAADAAQPTMVEPVPVVVAVPDAIAIPVPVQAPVLASPPLQAPAIAATAASPAEQPANPFDIVRIGFIETWMTVGVGIFILLLMPRFTQWVSWKLFNTNFVQFTIDVDETPVVVPYTKVPEFWSDLGPTLLGVVLITDGILFLTKRKPAVAAALVITFASTAYNLWYVVWSERGDAVSPPSLPVYSALAVLFGGMMLATQWLAFKSFPKTKRNAVALA